MRRILLPFPLAIIGFLMMLFAIEIIPLFEWQVSETSSDFLPAYRVDFVSSPWFARIGESLNDKSYVHTLVFVSNDKKYCSPDDLNIAVKRSRHDELLERISLFLNINERTSPLLLGWGVLQVIFSGIYMWWFTFRHENRSISGALASTLFSVMILYFFLLQALRGMGPDLSFPVLDDCQGTIRFNADLLRVNYAVPILLFTGILAELGTLNMMAYQIRAKSKRNESSKSAMG